MKKNEISGNSNDILKDNIAKLRNIFPEIISENQIDFHQLRNILGDYLTDENEKFQFTWSGKNKALQISQTPSLGTLRPDVKDSKNWQETENLYFEGNNLEVLKLLQKTYHNSIKMIYIDPPYNDGNDVIYEDDFKDNLKNYLAYTGQIDEKGSPLSTNKETSGRFHTNWLNMMYPRLRLAKNLLKNDGVIFISIDDNEVENLKKICNEIFGEENFEGHIHWRRRHNQPNDPTKMIALVAEHILAYAKSSKELKESGVGKVGLTGDFSNPDNDPRGNWASKPWKVGSGQSGSPYTITTPTGISYTEEWMGDENTYEELLKDSRIYFPNNGDGLPRKKYYEFEREQEGQCATNWWPHELFGHNQEGSAELEELFEVKQIFNNPKPTKLIENLIKIANVKSDDIVLDFFGGSSTTAHAVMSLNAKNNVSTRLVRPSTKFSKLLNNDSSISSESICHFFKLDESSLNTLKPISRL